MKTKFAVSPAIPYRPPSMLHIVILKGLHFIVIDPYHHRPDGAVFMIIMIMIMARMMLLSEIATFSLCHFVSSFLQVLYLKGHSRPRASHENGPFLKKAS